MHLHRMVISDMDYEKLMIVIENARRSRRWRSPYLELFEAQLQRARVVSPHDVPHDLVTMNSRVEVINRGSPTPTVFTLTYPDEPAEDALSVLSPMGRAMLGARVGDDVGWFSASGPESARVLSLMQQPEWAATCGAAGWR